MPSILFLQTLGLSRENAAQMLSAEGCTHEIFWPGEEISPAQKDNVELVVASQHKIGAAQLDEYASLKLVSLAFTGHDEVDKEYCRKRSLNVTFVPGYSTDSVAELTVFLAGVLLRKLSGAITAMREGEWDTATQNAVQKSRPRQLKNQTVGILGTGAIGMATARIFRGYGCKLIGWTNNPEKHPDFMELGGTFCHNKEDVFAKADIVSLHLELNANTEYTANAARLSLMRDNSMLINTARTYLVNPQELVQWLRENPDKSAALDITKKEQFDDVFTGVDNLILTPHLGCQTEQASSELAQVAISNLCKFPNQPAENLLLPD